VCILWLQDVACYGEGITLYVYCMSYPCRSKCARDTDLVC